MGNKHNKKAQAAMEFLMTYGWAILIVLVVLAALFFLGVFNPQISNSCLPVAPFTSCDVKITSAVAGQQIALQYPVGTASNVKLTSVSGVTCGAVSGAATSSIPSGTTPVGFTCTTSPGSVGAKYNANVAVSYTSSGGITHTTTLIASGTLE